MNDPHGPRKGTRDRQHLGDCGGTLCDRCGCCCHCKHSENDCPGQCRDSNCGCYLFGGRS